MLQIPKDPLPQPWPPTPLSPPEADSLLFCLFEFSLSKSPGQVFYVLKGKEIIN